eukprot:gene5255-6249_t
MLTGVQGSLKYVDNFGIQILIYVMLAWGLNIVVGLAGLLDLGYVAFYAVGAYSYALLAQQFGLSFWVLLPLAGILSAFWGVILGFPVLMDGGFITAPNLAFWTRDGGWGVENEGVAPDIEVEQTPALVIAGRDPQLEKAIEVIKAAPAGSSPARPCAPRPPSPDADRSPHSPPPES